MEIIEILTNIEKPVIYTPGTKTMWRDEYISKQLLEVHLNPEIDLASRKPETISKTTDWIMEQCAKRLPPSCRPLRILDLGCGPGLYAEQYAERGHGVTGVDFSPASIEYAAARAGDKNLNIEYHLADYLSLGFLKPGEFDLITMIYTDFGVLFPAQRDTLLETVKSLLRPEGLFIFDVLHDSDMETKISPKSWECSRGGFWSPVPYLALSDAFLYEEDKVILFQHTIIDDTNQLETYRFWTKFFSSADLEALLQAHGFSIPGQSMDVLPADGGWAGRDVIFCVARREEY